MANIAMEPLQKRAKQLRSDLLATLEALDFDALSQKEQMLTNAMARPGFWQDTTKAQAISQEQAKLKRRVEPWRHLQREVSDVIELANLGDDNLQADLEHQLDLADKEFGDLRQELKFNKSHDDNDAILSIYAGAGGTDAQDWVQMLLRMYVRYAEKNKWKVTTIDESAGEEAGLKSITIEIDGDFAYGKLRGEHGVHRLVRQSPFNSAASRETSFARVEVLPKIDQPDAVELSDKDLKIDVYRSGGHGGQSVNTTDSAVRITHIPTGITVAIQNERSQLQNKEVAMTILRSRLVQLQAEQHAEKLSELKPATGANEFGSQIRNYVLHPYKQVKDLRTKHESSSPETVLNGDLDDFIAAYVEHTLGQ